MFFSPNFSSLINNAYEYFRVEQSSPAPPTYNVQPQKTVIYQQPSQNSNNNKNYYNSSNYNYDPYSIYDDYDISRDVGEYFSSNFSLNRL